MKKFRFSIFIILSLLFLISAHAHPGRLDSNGGHYNRDTGEYHYHDGSSSGKNNNNKSDNYTYSHFEGPTKDYNSSSGSPNFEGSENETTTPSTNDSDDLSDIGLLIAIIGIICAFGCLWAYLSTDASPVIRKEKTMYKPKEEPYEFLSPVYAERLKKYQQESKPKKTPTEKRLEQIAGFPDGFYIAGFTSIDTISEETYGRATAYINNNDKILHLNFGCENATIPINMLFDGYEMKNFKLCEKCKNSPKYEFYENADVWYKKYITQKIAKDKKNGILK